MLAVEVRYLTGRCVATSADDRESAEWPPHPARLYSALVAVHYEDGGGGGERDALLWLERQPAPSIVASGASRRSVCTHYVPVNDAAVPRGSGDKAVLGATEVLPERRRRQPRTFPSVTPTDDRVWFVWPDAAPGDPVRRELGALVGRLTSLGHSSSLVAARLVDSAPAPTLVPADQGRLRLRIPGRGQLEALDAAHDVACRRGVRGRLPCDLQTYALVDEIAPDVPRTPFAEWIVFARRAGSGPDIATFAAVTGAFRDAAMSHAGDACPEVLSGHAADGSPSRTDHVAFVALPFVGDERGDGRLLGVAALLPRTISSDDRRAVLRALGGIREITMGRGGRWSVSPSDASDTARALDPDRWSGPACEWVTVTPIVLDRHPRELFGEESAAIVAASCERLGLPRPTVTVEPTSTVAGVPHARAFAARAKGRGAALRVHARIRFPSAVRGPLVVGAGRFRGFGLCAPVHG